MRLTIAEKPSLARAIAEDALQRLINGKPERPPNGSRLNVSRINKEAGLSSDGMYYYDDVIERARKECQF